MPFLLYERELTNSTPIHHIGGEKEIILGKVIALYI